MPCRSSGEFGAVNFVPAPCGICSRTKNRSGVHRGLRNAAELVKRSPTILPIVLGSKPARRRFSEQSLADKLFGERASQCWCGRKVSLSGRGQQQGARCLLG